MVVAGSQRMGPICMPGTMQGCPEALAPKSAMPPLFPLPLCRHTNEAHPLDNNLLRDVWHGRKGLQQHDFLLGQQGRGVHIQSLAGTSRRQEAAVAGSTFAPSPYGDAKHVPLQICRGLAKGHLFLGFLRSFDKAILLSTGQGA